jgi:hypothetical protein
LALVLSLMLFFDGQRCPVLLSVCCAPWPGNEPWEAIGCFPFSYPGRFVLGRLSDFCAAPAANFAR